MARMLFAQVRQSTQTICNGLFWDGIKGVIVHATEREGKTLCGKKVKDASYGWYDCIEHSEVTCPECKSKISP